MADEQSTKKRNLSDDGYVLDDDDEDNYIVPSKKMRPKGYLRFVVLPRLFL